MKVRPKRRRRADKRRIPELYLAETADFDLSDPRQGERADFTLL